MAASTASESYDAIIVGGGHNGLVAAAYLAKTGANTLVLEARSTTGGAATTEAPWPDAPEFKVTRLSYVMSLLPPTILNDLQLDQHGYKVFPMGPYYQAFPEGGSLTLYEEDSQRAYDEIARWVQKGRRGLPEVERLARRPCRRPRGPPGRASLHRRRDTDSVRQDPLPRGLSHHEPVHPVGPRGLGHRAAPR
jgi:phytoene dehydrogenase-like protein